MTGEVAWINKSGEDSNGEVWATHAAVAHAVGGTLEPFDKYQGPYIASPVGALWLCIVDDDAYPTGAIGYVFCARYEACSLLFLAWDDAAAGEAARGLVDSLHEEVI